jgi:uncharacterized cupin superfamily protein
VISHWDDRAWSRRDRGHIGGEWQSLTGGDSVTVGATRMRIDPGKWSTPAHSEAEAEEIFFVLSGSGISWQDGHCYPVREGDTLVHHPQDAAHTLRAGDDGLEVIAFGHRAYGGATFLPRAGVSWLGRTWARTGAEDEHPWALEAAAGPPEVGELEPRPASIVNVDEIEPKCEPHGSVGDSWRALAERAGSERAGLNHCVGIPGLLVVAPHCHSAEEEIYVVLGGEGEALLYPRGSTEPEAQPIRRGSVFCRPPGTRVPHSVRSGDDPLVCLVYGTREPNDICYYPRSGKIAFRGVGVIGRIEPLDYWDGED